MPPCENKHTHLTLHQKEDYSHDGETTNPTSVDMTESDNLDVHYHNATEDETKLTNDREKQLQSIMKKDESYIEPENTASIRSNEEEMNSITESKSVQFSALQIRTFPMILGDHPCCKTGLPVSLDWDHTKEEVVPIEEYESNREARSSRSSLRMDQSTRREILGQVSDQNDLKRAERKMFRERERGGKRRMTTNDFFGKPSIIDASQE
jgi:hypothetical protein